MTEVRALEKCRVSQSFTSHSRICGKRGAQRGSSLSPKDSPGTKCLRTQPGTGTLAPGQHLEGSGGRGGDMPGRESLDVYVLPL